MNSRNIKMLYVTGMDNTVIYDREFINTNNINCKYICVDKVDENELSFISYKMREHLRRMDITSGCRVIPMTHRSYESYKNIKFNFIPEYSIVCNGGKVLFRNRDVEEWNEYVHDIIDWQELFKIMQDIYTGYKLSVEIEDNCRLKYIVNSVGEYENITS